MNKPIQIEILNLTAMKQFKLIDIIDTANEPNILQNMEWGGKNKSYKRSAIYLVNQTTAHTALSTILSEHRDVLTYRRLYNYVWDKPLIAEGLTIVKIPLVKPCRNRQRVVY